ncbi:redoxin family protein [Cysteiniphilum litorale]|uniref:redoxin family protein n=1 Tax=Cysteiniphilum litorale TaxID=2056700 RepID=UPI003F881FA8
MLNFSLPLAFLEGIGLVVQPCIIPILPFMLAGGATGGKRKPYGIIVGFILTFTLATLLLRALIKVTGIPDEWINNVAYALLILMGITMVFDSWANKFSMLTQRFTDSAQNSKTLNNNEGGFFSGIIFGALISIVWVPCAGPILAAVILQTITSQTTYYSYLILLAFSLGSAIPMFIIAIFSRKIIGKIAFLRQRSQLIKKVFGVVIILSSLIFGYTNVVQKYFVTNASAADIMSMSSTTTPGDKPKIKLHSNLKDGLNDPYDAPTIAPGKWITDVSVKKTSVLTEFFAKKNGDVSALNFSELKGKVVLVDFWTYSCINCIRTVPNLENLYQKYGKYGFVVIGVHSPEFPFEEKYENVAKAVKDFKITYPVVQDNKFATWLRYENKYWPQQYLIDQDGQVVYRHDGEGDEDVIEHNIKQLLNLNKNLDENSASSQISEDVDYYSTPETYPGLERAERFANKQGLHYGVNLYKGMTDLKLNYWGLSGLWEITDKYITPQKAGAEISLHFTARQVYMVAGLGDKQQGASFEILLNGKPLNADRGSDISSKNELLVSDHRLYRLLSFKKVTNGVIALKALRPGAQIYTFSFG